MKVREVLGVVLTAGEDEPVLAALDGLLHRDDHGVALLLATIPDPAYGADGVMSPEIWPQVIALTREQFAMERSRLEKRPRAAGAGVEIRVEEVQASRAGTAAAFAARHADLTVMLRPGGGLVSEERQALFEAVLFGAGRPVLLVPPDWRPRPIGRSIAVGWNASREASRALADAVSLFQNGGGATVERVSVITVDPQRSPGDAARRSAAGICGWLERKGLNATLHPIGAQGQDEGEVLLAEAHALGADLLVVGGYGKTRIREFVFGGVTRSLVRIANLPLLMSH